MTGTHVDLGAPAPILMGHQRTSLSVRVEQLSAILSVVCFVTLETTNALMSVQHKMVQLPILARADVVMKIAQTQQDFFAQSYLTPAVGYVPAW